MKKLILKLTNLLMSWAVKNNRVFKITGTAGPDDVYLIRYYIVRSKMFCFYIHQFLRSDRDDLHDHPWNFCTYLVNGAYTENKFNPQTGQVEQTRRENNGNKLNTFVIRKATDLHQVVVDKDLKEYQKDQAALTLFFSGPVRREWGFVKEGQWIDWRTYLGLPKNTPGRG